MDKTLRRRDRLAIALVAATVALALPAAASPPDPWVTTKAKIALLTTEGLEMRDVNVDTVDGKVTIHGTVTNEADRAQAEELVKGIDGVVSVKNLVQVVPASRAEDVEAADDAIREDATEALERNRDLEDADIKVASVNKGVVLLSGTAKSMDQELRAIMTVAEVKGVRRVTTEVVSDDEK